MLVHPFSGTVFYFTISDKTKQTGKTIQCSYTKEAISGCIYLHDRDADKDSL
jgi:hypothetical protein